jgi:rhodanese-related sulfurtransferase
MNEIDFFESKIKCTLSPIDFLALLKNNPEGLVLVDVRNAPPHILKEKIKGAIILPQKDIEKNLDKLPKDKTIILYCWETWCNLAAKSAIILLENGYNVKELAGRIAAWKTMNFETEAV